MDKSRKSLGTALCYEDHSTKQLWRTYQGNATFTLGRFNPCRYSYDYGPIHFLHYSTEHDFSTHSPQWEFIKADLEGVNRALTPWVVVGGHRPIYIDSTNTQKPDGDQPVSADLQEALERLLLDNHVDVTLHGHHHSYQRTCPVYHGECMGYDFEGVPRAPIHLVIGNAGAGLCLNIKKQQPKVCYFFLLIMGTYDAVYSRMLCLNVQTVAQGVSNMSLASIDFAFRIKSILVYGKYS